MGDCWSLPTIEIKTGDSVQAVASNLLSSLGLKEEDTAVYPDHFTDVIFQIRREADEALVWTPQGSFTSGGSPGKGVTVDEKLQAELLVIVSPKAKVNTTLKPKVMYRMMFPCARIKRARNTARGMWAMWIRALTQLAFALPTSPTSSQPQFLTHVCTGGRGAKLGIQVV